MSALKTVITKMPTYTAASRIRMSKLTWFVDTEGIVPRAQSKLFKKK